MQSNRASKKTKIAEENATPVTEMNAGAEGTSKPRTSRSSKLKKEASETGPAKHRKTSPAESIPSVAHASPIIDPVGVVAPAINGAMTAATPAEISPTHEDIAKLAYSYWVARGYGHGSMHDDWLRAERELGTKR